MKKGKFSRALSSAGLILLACLLFAMCAMPDAPESTVKEHDPFVQQETGTAETAVPSIPFFMLADTDPSVTESKPAETAAGTTPQQEEPETLLPETEPSVTSVPETTAPAVSGSMEVHFIDVGQADAALVLCGDHAMLIDGGNSADSSLIYAYLKQRGISRLDYIICTHAHEDHVGGLSGALNYASADLALCSVTEGVSKAFNSFLKYLDKGGTPLVVPEAGSVYSLGNASFRILGPIHTSDEPNNMSLVIRLEFGDTSFLFTGDAEYDEETDILDAGCDVSADVLKVGHHGSSSSTSYRWLRSVAPSCAVISVGEDNSYGHPTEAVLSRLRDADVKTYRTDMQGTVICISDGKNLSFSVSRNPKADTLSDAGAGGNHAQETTAATDAGGDKDAAQPDYILNTNTHKFHTPGCSSVSAMSQKNKKEYNGSRDDVISMGYSPCGRCNP